VLVGGLDLMEQAISLTRKPHIIIGTPGRVADHLQNTKGFSLKNLKFLVLDEADRLLNMDFEKEINLIVGAAPRDRTTFLFSATMTNKVQKLQRACLRKEAVKVEVSSKYQTVETLTQNYLFLPAQYKDTYLIHLLSKFMGNSIIIFTDTTANATKLTLMLSKLSYSAVALFGKLTQNKRFEALNKFKAKGRNIL
jgi:ATP-dependent RNA helicase DDX47/RRP3